MIDPKRQSELHAAIEAFFFAYRAFTAPPDRLLAARGLGRVHHRILYFVARRPGLPVSALLAVLAVSKQALHAPLRQLLDSGLIVARPAAHDRRVKELALSAAGVALEAELSGAQMALLEKLLAEQGPAAEAGWRAVMASLSGSGEALGNGPGEAAAREEDVF